MTSISLLLGSQASHTRSNLRRSKASLSGEMALRIGKAFGVKMETLMQLQSAFDTAETRSHEKEIRVRRFHPRAEAHS
jgi:plasmid maintenance system antidote protein VapI